MVYRARRGDFVVAVKFLRTDAGGEAEAALTFRREAATLATLSHPCVVQVFEIGDAGGLPYVIMEYVEGRTLAARLAAGPLSELEAIQLGVQLAGVLGEVHRRRLIHRDLRPQSVVFPPNASGFVKLVDFDLRLDAAPPAPPGRGLPRPRAERHGRPHRRCPLRPLRARGHAVRGRLRPPALPRPRPRRAAAPARRARPAAAARAGAALLARVRGRGRPPAGQGPRRPVPVGRGDRAGPARHRRVRCDRSLRTYLEGQARRPAGRPRARAAPARGGPRARPRGLGGGVLVTGEPGSGKSRLLAAFAAARADEGVPVLAVRCQAEARPLAGLRAAVDPHLRRLRPDTTALAGGDGGELVSATVDALALIAEAHPGAVLWVDDAEVIDEATLAALRLLVGRIAELSLLLVAVGRFERWAGELDRDGACDSSPSRPWPSPRSRA
ncbi:protein kinase domain-containing protein [Nannocystis pusilla]|uniref:protein kinase domain-containing protein n=1 Tax=Nannocystis pusilla TaxID=889268 RepID=UPI003B76F1C4